MSSLTVEIGILENLIGYNFQAIQTLTKELLLVIAELARQCGMIIFSYEIYDRMVFDGPVHIPIASFSADVLVVIINGWSKSYRICGFRIVYLPTEEENGGL